MDEQLVKQAGILIQEQIERIYQRLDELEKIQTHLGEKSSFYLFPERPNGKDEQTEKISETSDLRRHLENIEEKISKLCYGADAFLNRIDQ